MSGVMPRSSVGSWVGGFWDMGGSWVDGVNVRCVLLRRNAPYGMWVLLGLLVGRLGSGRFAEEKAGKK